MFFICVLTMVIVPEISLQCNHFLQVFYFNLQNGSKSPQPQQVSALFL